MAQYQSPGLSESTGVSDHVPITCKSIDSLHGLEVDTVGAENIIGGRGVEAQIECLRVSNDRGSSQALEDPYLNFLRIKRHQPIEADFET